MQCFRHAITTEYQMPHCAESNHWDTFLYIILYIPRLFFWNDLSSLSVMLRLICIKRRDDYIVTSNVGDFKNVYRYPLSICLISILCHIHVYTQLRKLIHSVGEERSETYTFQLVVVSTWKPLHICVIIIMAFITMIIIFTIQECSN